MATGAPVVVAGGGIGGLALALALARHGTPVQILERALTLTEIGAGLQLSPNANRILEQLGLGPALDAVAVEPSALHMRDGRTGTLIANLPLAAARGRWGAPYRLIHRADLQERLRAAAISAGAEISLDRAVIAFHVQSAGITVDTARGAVAGSALIGADGVNSTIRRGLGDVTAPTTSAMVGWRTLIPAADWPVGIARDSVSLWFGTGGHLVVYPLRDATVFNVVACIPGSAADVGPQRDGQRLRRFFTGWAAAVRAIIDVGSDWTVWPLQDRAPGYLPGRGAVALIGDAAHPALPHFAQGAAMAIEDAAVTAARLAAAPDDPAGGLRRVERARAMRVARVQREARRNGRIYTLGALPAAARDLTLRTLGPERLMRRLDWLYGWGAAPGR